MDAKEARIKIWEDIRAVARPDSRFSWDFREFITDYEGSDRCADILCTSELYQNSQVIFVTPDNNLEVFRERLLRDKKTLVITNYGISRGFFVVKPGDVPDGKEEIASLLDGVQRYWKHYTLERIAREVGHVDLMVTGASAMTPSGLRFGKGHGYFDLEYAMLTTAGAADERSVIVGVGHDLQVIDVPVERSVFDTAIDYIVTPTAMVKTRGEFPRPTCGVVWSLLEPDMIGRIPPLQELWQKIACK